MAGMLNQPGAAPAAPAPAAGPSDPAAPSGYAPAAGTPTDDSTVDDSDGDESPNVTPEEQQAYDNLVNSARELIYAGGRVNPNIAKMLDDDPSDLIAVLGQGVSEGFGPVLALAATTVVIMLEVLQRTDPQPADDVILHAGKEVLEDLADMAKQTSIHTYSQEDINQAMLHAVNLYRITATAEGRVDVEALKQEFADILNAQEKGDLPKILPGIERYDHGGVR